MAPVINGRVLFKSIPQGFPEPGKTTIYDTTQKLDPDSVALNGGFLVKTLVLSIDPYMRGRMRPVNEKSYVPAFEIGKPLTSHGVAVVIRSEMDGVKVGDHVYGMMTHEHHSIRDSAEGLRVITNEHKLPWSVYVGAAGMPGKTAFMAWREYSKAKKGEVLFVSTGGGPVGSLVIQLAKLDGLKIIASAGSDEKVEFMKSIGADVAFNYKTTNTREVLGKEGPINIFWDNVGGETLEAALDAAEDHARFIECGMISGYNKGGAPVRNLMRIVQKSITMYGFLVTSLEPKYEQEFYKFITEKLASGELRYTEEVTKGLDKVGDLILAVQQGKNKAKVVVAVAEE